MEKPNQVITFSKDAPIYLQFADFLRQEIISGKIQPGDRIPSVRDLAELYTINPNTAQRAIGLLESESLVVPDSTNGKFVTKEKGIIKAAREQQAQQIAANLKFQLENANLKLNEVTKYL